MTSPIVTVMVQTVPYCIGLVAGWNLLRALAD